MDQAAINSGNNGFRLSPLDGVGLGGQEDPRGILLAAAKSFRSDITIQRGKYVATLRCFREDPTV
jgi:hypothetical protein